MAQITHPGQTCLEATGIEMRPVQVGRNEFRREEQYSEAVAEKTTFHGGHNHFLPDCSRKQLIGDAFTSPIDYSNFDSHNEEGGSKCDRYGVPHITHSGRRGNRAINIFSPNNPYGFNSVNTEANRLEGQFVNGTTLKTPILCNLP